MRKLSSAFYNSRIFLQDFDRFQYANQVLGSLLFQNEKGAKDGKEKEDDSKDKEEKKDEEVVATKLGTDTPPRLFLAYVTQVRSQYHFQ